MCMSTSSRRTWRSRLTASGMGWPHWRYTWRCVAELYGTRGWRERLHQWWRKMQVHARLIAEAEAFLKPWEGQRIIGAHVRNNQHAAEQPSGRMPRLVQWFECLERQASDWLIYLATDNEEAVFAFRKRFGNRLVVREIPRSGNLDTEFHLNFRQTRRDVENCFLDALILAMKKWCAIFRTGWQFSSVAMKRAAAKCVQPT